MSANYRLDWPGLGVTLWLSYKPASGRVSGSLQFKKDGTTGTVGFNGVATGDLRNGTIEVGQSTGTRLVLDRLQATVSNHQISGSFAAVVQFPGDTRPLQLTFNGVPADWAGADASGVTLDDVLPDPDTVEDVVEDVVEEAGDALKENKGDAAAWIKRQYQELRERPVEGGLKIGALYLGARWLKNKFFGQ